jgi:hypothetical protein
MAQSVLDRLATHGALFFDELVDGSRLLRTQVEEALAELVALGLVNSDSFGGLRALLVPSAQRRPIGAARRRGRVLSFGMESAGRWSLIPRNDVLDTITADDTVLCSGASRAKPPGCRHGAISCASIAGSRHAEKFAAAVLSLGSPASSMLCRRLSVCSERPVGRLSGRKSQRGRLQNREKAPSRD